MFDGLLSVTDEHARTVQNSHTCHDTLAAFFGSFLGTLEHLLKFVVEFFDAFAGALHFRFEFVGCHGPPSSKKTAGTQNLSAYVSLPF
jgi:hypothetical protein